MTLDKFTLNQTAPLTEFSSQFIQGMIDRMGISFAKYGKVKDAYPLKVHALDSMNLRIKKYRETGNTEFLIDAANFCMIEFMHPLVENAYFAATDSDQSPGRKFHDIKFPTSKSNE